MKLNYNSFLIYSIMTNDLIGIKESLKRNAKLKPLNIKNTEKAVKTMRTIGTLIEDNILPISSAINCLENELNNAKPERRLAAINALWQANAKDSLNAIKIQTKIETNYDVMITLKHVINIFEK